ncbi:pilin [Neisseriaceae bacterium TC5R-5]|nr:pilin [Neisseriaceae bacterium TC5R-5]
MTGLQLAAPVKLAVVRYHTIHGVYPDADDAHTILGISAPEQYKSGAIDKIQVGEEGEITLTYNDKVTGNKGTTANLLLTPNLDESGGALYQWKCTLPSGVEVKYAPSECTAPKQTS